MLELFSLAPLAFLFRGSWGAAMPFDLLRGIDILTTLWRRLLYGPQRILTFVFPLMRGCVQDCDECFVAQRFGDRKLFGDNALQPEHYVLFLDQTVQARGEVLRVCLQGFEPLDPGAIHYTLAVLKRCSELGIQVSLVTHGVFLKQYLPQLMDYRDMLYIVVSVHGPNEALHGEVVKKNTFNTTIEGVKVALEAKFVISVTSILYPDGLDRLRGMPALLAELGIADWIVNAAMRTGDGQVGGPIDDRATILTNLRILDKEAKHHSIAFRFDDEFVGYGYLPIAWLAKANWFMDAMVLFFRTHRLHPWLVTVSRLEPDGICPVGQNIMISPTEDDPRWSPSGIPAPAFVAAAA